MRMYDIIDKKRKGLELTTSELKFFVDGYTNGEIPDYQASALLMAICFSGMTDNETAVLTQIMANSGDTLDLSEYSDLSVDKHSTGGVGDKTTLIISPIVASLGCVVAKMSGRGLGHTGGTIDKLESIDGFKTELTHKEFIKISSECGICVCGAAANLVPADKKLYALRDVTATVNSIPLIVSSIMSKKLAGGAKSIVLDVKTGSGAFMKTVEDSKELANRMVSIGKLSERNVSAVITNMDRPLGRNIGNALEVAEAYEFLNGINVHPDLYKVCVALASEMVSLAKSISIDESRDMVIDAIQSKKALAKFEEWIALQYGDVSLFKNTAEFVKAKYVTNVVAQESGYIVSADAEGIGVCAMMLGAGRAAKTDVIDMKAGIVQYKNVGDYVNKGDVLAILQSNTVADHSAVVDKYKKCLDLSSDKPQVQPLIYEIIR